MEQRPFTDKSVQPDEQLLKNTLGRAYKFYAELDNLTASLKKTGTTERAAAGCVR